MFETDDAGDGLGVIELGGEQADCLIVVDITLDGFLGVIGLLADHRDGVSFEVERDDLLLVSLPAAEVLDVAAGGWRTAVDDVSGAVFRSYSPTTGCQLSSMGRVFVSM